MASNNKALATSSRITIFVKSTPKLVVEDKLYRSRTAGTEPSSYNTSAFFSSSSASSHRPTPDSSSLCTPNTHRSTPLCSSSSSRHVRHKRLHDAAAAPIASRRIAGSTRPHASIRSERNRYSGPRSSTSNLGQGPRRSLNHLAMSRGLKEPLPPTWDVLQGVGSLFGEPVDLWSSGTWRLE